MQIYHFGSTSALCLAPRPLRELLVRLRETSASMALMASARILASSESMPVPARFNSEIVVLAAIAAASDSTAVLSSCPKQRLPEMLRDTNVLW